MAQYITYELDSGKKVRIPKEEIERNMKLPNVKTEEDAIWIWLEDEGIIDNEEQNALDQKAKENRRYEQSAEKKVRKPREKKIDEDKVKIISFLQRAMIDSDALNIVIKNEQREITFTYNGAEYSLTLTKHRPPKK